MIKNSYVIFLLNLFFIIPTPALADILSKDVDAVIIDNGGQVKGINDQNNKDYQDCILSISSTLDSDAFEKAIKECRLATRRNAETIREPSPSHDNTQ